MLEWQTSQFITNYTIRYGKSSDIPVPANPDLGNLSLIQANGSQQSLFVGGLEKNTEYIFYLIPENECGVPFNFSTGMIDFSTAYGTTNNSSCSLPIAPSMMYLVQGGVRVPVSNGADILPQLLTMNDLPPNGANVLNLCELNGIFEGNQCYGEEQWVDFSSSETMVYLDLGTNYELDQIFLYDASDRGIFKVEWSDDETSGFEGNEILVVDTKELCQWRFFTNLQQPTGGVRYLRFRNTDQMAKLLKLFICGHPAPTCTDDPIGPPGPAQPLTATSTPTTLTATWPALPLDPDLAQGELILTYAPTSGGTTTTVGGIATTATSYTIMGLECGAKYIITLLVKDCAGNESATSETILQTQPCAPCGGCSATGFEQSYPESSCSSIFLRWTPPTVCTTTEYEIAWFENAPGLCEGAPACPETPPGNAASIILPGGATSAYEITGLSQLSGHCAYIRSNSQEEGWSCWQSTLACTFECEGCPCTAYQLAPSMIISQTSPPPLDAVRLVDEQALGSGQPIDPFCGDGGVPLTEWGEFWKNNPSGALDVEAILDLGQDMDLGGIALFDGKEYDNHPFEVYLGTLNPATSAWEYSLLFSYNPIGTSPDGEWVTFKNGVDFNIPAGQLARRLRFKKTNNHARVYEVSVCRNSGSPEERGSEKKDLGLGKIGQAKREDISLFPNPATNRLTLQFPPALYNSLAIMDLHGKTILATPLLENEKERQLNLAHFPSGAYLLRLDGTDGRSVYRRFVKI